MEFIGFDKVSLESGFLHEKQKLNREVTLDAVYNRFYETGRFDAFKCDWKEGMEKQPHYYWDSDVAKWMEAVAYILKKESNPELEAKVENLIDEIEKNQSPDGYFNIFFTVIEPDKRFFERTAHELYCAGHLFEAAVAYFECTGKDRFLKLMEKYADHIIRVFVEEKTAKFITPGHEEIELALVRMYSATKKKKYLDLAKFFIDNRGYAEAEKEYYSQSHLPVREQKTAEGHAVRACYLYAAMADVAYETGDTELYEVCKTLFADIVNKKMYITGGIGSTRKGEAFTVPYDLKNDKAYAETCAAISLMFFAHRMMRFENDAKYADVIERVLYNGMISGLSLDGTSFFYENPLEIDLKNYTRFKAMEGEKYAITARKKVFDCSCCPPNLNRVLATLGNYIYGVDGETLFVNQFVGSTAEIDGMKIKQTADFPRSGEIRIFTENVKKLCIRIPGWCENYEIDREHTVENGYAVIENPQGEVSVKFAIEPVLVQSNSEVSENSGKVAVCCGPYVCAAEAIDNIENLHSIFVDKNLKAEARYDEAMCGYVLDVKAYRRKTDDKLYSKYSENFEDFTLKLIPYASFANRGESNMCVWLNVR
ncbi:MAG: glycoside hydrolase family 127 protein [Oscillospiraceae bacterium]|nr:glycoside hydrolase family 127 protein [Oscillospiraceae bacterium]